MLSKKIETALNKQIAAEAASSHIYLAMASWAEIRGFDGIVQFFYKHSDEERSHMLKIFRYVNERGGCAIVPALKEPLQSFKSLRLVFEEFLRHEEEISHAINELVDKCLKEKDHTTYNFLQWFVAEQIEEEALAHAILDKLNLIGDDKGGLYLLDRDIENITVTNATSGISA